MENIKELEDVIQEVKKGKNGKKSLDRIIVAPTINMIPVQKVTVNIPIVGKTPYLANRMPPAVAESIDCKKSGKMVKKDSRSERDESKVEEKIYKTEKGEDGLLASSFYKAMIAVAVYIDGLDMKLVRGSVRVNGNVIPLNYKKKVLNESVGRQSGMTKAPMLIVRPEYQDWSCMLNITFNESNISLEHIYNLLDWAGFQIGVGGWRPEKGGSYGQFEVKR